MDNLDQELLTAWAELKKKKFENFEINKTDIMDAIRKESSTTLSGLRKSLMHKLAWIVFFIIAFTIWMFIESDKIELIKVLGFFTALYAISFVALLPLYFKMDDSVNMTENTLTTLKKNRTLLKNMFMIERLFAVFGLPISIIVGALIRRIYNGQTIAGAMSDTKLLFFLIGCIIVITPILFYISEKMNEMAFGKNRSKLEQNIARLEVLY